MEQHVSGEERVLNGGETSPDIVRSRFDWTAILPIVPIPIFLVLLFILAALDVGTVFEPPWLLPALNTLFLAILPLTVVYVATKGYVKSGSITLLMLGTGTLTLGLGAFLAGWVITAKGGGPNANVTIFNLSALLSATFYCLGVVLAVIGLSPRKDTWHRKLNVTLSYLGVAILMALVTIATLKGFIPVFFVQGEGPTVWRQTVVVSAATLLILSGGLLAGLHLFSRANLLYWYLLALFLLGTGLICVLFQKSVGGPIGWLGRSALYLAGVYLLVSVISASRDLGFRGKPLEIGIANLFRHRLEFLVEERTSQLSRANIQLSHEIFERKKAEGSLHESELMLRTILATSPVGIALTKERRIEWANEAWKQLFGFEDEHEYLGQDARMLYPSEEEYEHAGKMLYQDLETGKVGQTDTKFRRKDGSVFDAHLQIKALDPLDPAKGTISAVSDISSRKRAEEALRESEARFRNVFEQGPVGIAIVGLDYRLVAVNNTLCEMVGYRADELTKLTFVDITHPEDIEADVRYSEKLSRGEIPSYTMEKRYIRKNGEVIWISLTGSIVRDDEGKALYFLAMIEDISERKRAEDQLQKSEALFRSVFESTTDSILVWDKNYNYLYANQAAIDHVGTTRDNVIGKNMRDGLGHVPDFMHLWMGRVDQVFATGRPMQVSDSMTVGDKIVFSESILSPIMSADGSMFAVGVVYRDVSERRKAEEVRRRLVTAIEQAAEAVVITNTDGVIQYVNPATEQITGFERSEIIGNNPRIFKSGEHDRAFYEQLWNTITAGNAWSGRIINKKKDGTLYHEDATISPVRDASGKIVNFVAVKRDVTEHLELSRRLFQAQKMEAIGTLASGVAHDFNNLLTVVLGYSELLLTDTDQQDPVYADLDKINKAALNGADLVQRLLAFSRKAGINPCPLNLNHQIEQLQKMLTRTIPKMIEIELNLADGLSPVSGDPTQMDQVLMNLAVNAKDAMPDGGKLTFETANVFLDEEYARTHLQAKPGEYVLLSVSDNGHGMDKETLDHIFEPFYTTKEVGKGTGLGLAMVYGIVHQHGGQIRCCSEPGLGTTFKIYLPAIVGEGTASKKLDREAMPRGGTETILLVDDEEFVRDLGKRALERSGYTVLTAANGKEALDLYKRERARISLVILDLIMPEMGGKQCLEELLKIDPKARVLIASGFAANGQTTEALETGARGFVGKPYNMKGMLQSVREVLDSERQPMSSAECVTRL